MHVALALEENLEAHERVDLEDADPVDAAVFRAAGDRHFLEPRLAEKALAELFEAGRRQFLQDGDDVCAMVGGRELAGRWRRRLLRHLVVDYLAELVVDGLREAAVNRLEQPECSGVIQNGRYAAL